jgi:5-methylcytosine-specific restriction endonuclease McrA
MSRHHVEQKWSTHSPKFREKIARTLPQPCIECGGIITKADSWHVGHRVAAEDGGRPRLANVGPAHARCNLKSGGKRGARVTNARRNRAKDIREW